MFAGPSLTRSAGTSLVVQVAGAGLGMAVQVLLARAMSLGEFGAYSYAVSWVGFVVLVGRGGFDKSAVRFLPQYDAVGDSIASAAFRRFSVRFSLVASTLAAGVTALGVLLVGSQLGASRQHALVAALLIAPPLAALQVESSHLRAARQAALSVVPESVAQPILLALFVGAAAVAGLRVNAVTAALYTALACALVAVALHVFVGRRVGTTAGPREDPALRRLWLTASGHLALGGAAALVLVQADVIVLGIVSTPEAVARYVVAAKLGVALNLLPSAVGLILAPTLTHLLARGERAEAQRVLTTSTRVALLGVALLAAALAVSGHLVLSLFGNEYRGGYDILLIILAAQVLFAAAGPSEIVLAVSERPGSLTAIFAGSAAANVLLLFLLVPRYGPEGAAAIAGGVRVVETHLARIKVRRLLGLATGPFGAQLRSE
ncbi:MAG: hypothetical protein QOE45_1090 [Frankiaceae bacterium]|nr:hypothetical protein [Frankiaceae bacterium]